MSILSVYHVSSPDLPNKVLTHTEDIASTLAEHGVGFERVQAEASVIHGASQEEVISACREQIDALMTARGYRSVEVISCHRDQPQGAEAGSRFLKEHQQDADELRFFVAGRGLLNLHIGEFVYAVQCDKHDLISLPAGTRQWFDLGQTPHLVAISLFKSANGGAVTFTGDDIAERFPGLDE